MPPRRMGLGLNLPYVERSMDGSTPRWADIRAMAVAAEELGFDAVWISDHVGFGDPAGEWTGAWESWTLLSALAVATNRVHLGTYVLAAPFRNPALLAKMAETLDEVSGGRLVLGLGAGWNEPEFEAFDVPFETRFDRFEDTLRIIAAMLREGVATHDGRTVRARGARVQPRGPRPSGPPIMVGAGGRRLLRLTAELADTWNGGLRSADELPALLDRLDAACTAVGRDPATLSRSAEALVRTIPARDAVAEPRELRGNATELADALRAYAALGLDHLQVQLRPNSVAGVRAFGPVLEELRTAASGVEPGPPGGPVGRTA